MNTRIAIQEAPSTKKQEPSGICDQRKIDAMFDRLTEVYGINKTAVIHKALLRGNVTQEIRRQVRRVLRSC